MFLLPQSKKSQFRIFFARGGSELERSVRRSRCQTLRRALIRERDADLKVLDAKRDFGTGLPDSQICRPARSCFQMSDIATIGSNTGQITDVCVGDETQLGEMETWRPSESAA